MPDRTWFVQARRQLLRSAGREVRYAAVLTAAAFSLFGCERPPDRGTSNASQNAPPTPAGAFSVANAAAPYRGKTIHLIGEAQPPLEAIRQLSADFTRETGIAVQIDAVGYDLLLERATLDITSGTGRYDVVFQTPEGWGRFAARGLLYPLDSLRARPGLRDPSFNPDRDLFEHAAKDLGWYRGVAYGYPMIVATMNVWYRKDLFEDPGERQRFRARYGYDLQAPATWQQYRDIAEFFTRPAQGLYGTVLQAKRHPSLWQEWLNIAYSFGGGTLAHANAWEYGDILVNSPESKEATRYYVGLRAFAPPGTLEYTWDDALALMQQGKVALALMWTDMSQSIEDPTSSKVVGKIGFAPPPAGRAGVVGQISGLAALIPKSAKNPEPAYLFIQWLLRPEIQIRYQLAGGQSPYRAVYDDPRVRARLPYAAAVRTTLDHGITMRETFPEAQGLGDKVQVRLSEIMSGRTSVDRGLDALAIDLHTLLGDKAPLRYPPRARVRAVPAVR